MLVVIMVMEW